MKNKLLKKTYWQFIIKMVIWTVVMFSCLFLVKNYIENSDFQWAYEIDQTVYYSFKNYYRALIGGKIASIMIFMIWLLGALIIIYRLLKKVFGYVNAISDASNDMLNSDIEYIKLPTELEDIQEHMNKLKQMNRKNELLAKENEQKKDDLIAYLAHDLKTPLTSIIGYLSLLEDVEDMPKKQKRKYIKIALDKSYRLEDLINELFDIARFNSEKIVLRKGNINLNLMLEQIIDDFYPMLKENNREIKCCFYDTIELDADADKLARVFSNLIKNAIYYSTEKCIDINIKKENSLAIITIINKGDLIPEEKLSRIFEKFYRIDSSRSSSTGGSGLGLAISKEIIELHGGKITAKSNKNETCFIVELPI